MAIRKPTSPKMSSPASKPKQAAPSKAAPKMPPKKVNQTGNKNTGKTYVAKPTKVGKAPGQHTVPGSDHIYVDPKSGKKKTVFVAKPKPTVATPGVRKYKRKPKGSGGGTFSK